MISRSRRAWPMSCSRPSTTVSVWASLVSLSGEGGAGGLPLPLPWVAMAGAASSAAVRAACGVVATASADGAVAVVAAVAEARGRTSAAMVAGLGRGGFWSGKAAADTPSGGILAGRSASTAAGAQTNCTCFRSMGSWFQMRARRVPGVVLRPVGVGAPWAAAAAPALSTRSCCVASAVRMLSRRRSSSSRVMSDCTG